MNTERKTQRKNKTKQVINWPSPTDYFTIDSLIAINQHMLTAPPKCSDITLRVRLMKAVKGDGCPKTVSSIGTLNVGKGRPQLVFAMMPVQPEVLEKAKADKVMLVSETESVPVVNITKQSTFRFPVNSTEPVKVVETEEVKA